MVFSIFTRDRFRTEDRATASGAIFLRVFRFDRAGVIYFVLNIRGSNLRTKLYVVATLAIEAIEAIIVGQTVQHTSAVHATETVLVIP